MLLKLSCFSSDRGLLSVDCILLENVTDYICGIGKTKEKILTCQGTAKCSTSTWFWWAFSLKMDICATTALAFTSVYQEFRRIKLTFMLVLLKHWKSRTYSTCCHLTSYLQVMWVHWFPAARPNSKRLLMLQMWIVKHVLLFKNVLHGARRLLWFSQPAPLIFTLRPLLVNYWLCISYTVSASTEIWKCVCTCHVW